MTHLPCPLNCNFYMLSFFELYILLHFLPILFAYAYAMKIKIPSKEVLLEHIRLFRYMKLM